MTTVAVVRDTGNATSDPEKKKGSAAASYPGLFAGAVPVESGIHLLYTRESLWIEKDFQPYN